MRSAGPALLPAKLWVSWARLPRAAPPRVAPAAPNQQGFVATFTLETQGRMPQPSPLPGLPLPNASKMYYSRRLSQL